MASCEDAGCCGCCDPQGDLAFPELAEEIDQADMDAEPWDGFQTDAEADGDALASAGLGTDEDYEHYLIDDEFATEAWDEL